MKKIIITANSSWYIYNFRKNTLLTLVSNGYDVTVVAPLDKYSSEFFNLGCKYIDIKITPRGKNPISDFLLLRNFFSLYKKNTPDVVLNFTPKNNIYSTLAASFLGIATVNNIAGLGTVFIKDGIVCRLTRVLYKISQPKASVVFFQNEDDLRILLNKRIVPKDITQILPGSGVDLKRFTFSPAKNDDVVRFILVARMLFDKGICYYASAAKVLKNIYGDKVEFNLLGFIDEKNPGSVNRKMISSWVNDGYINYLGVSDKVEDEISHIDCVVLPSFYREGVPRSLLEAAAMGKPIVTTDNVGCKETVEDGVNGFLCEPRSAESLMQAMNKIIKLSHEQRLTMGCKSRELVERKFDEKIVIEKYINAIKSITV